MNCAEFLKSALSKNPSTFQRLVYLAGTWDRESGQYQEPVLSLAYGGGEAHRVLCREHAAAFHAWLCLGLEEQTADLTWYVENAASHDQREMLKEWMKLKWYETLIPIAASEADQILYRSDMEIVLPLLYAETTIKHPYERSSKGIDFSKPSHAHYGR